MTGATAPAERTKVAIIGSGNIGTDLMMKVLRLSPSLRLAALVGIDPASDGLARARRHGVATIDTGARGLLELPEIGELAVVFDATSAKAHLANATLLAGTGTTLIDLTPAAIGPFVVPAVNLEQHLGAANLNMVTCGGQATIPIVAAVSQVSAVPYAEIVASIAARSAGPGTRANIDEFTQTTAAAIEVVGGAARGKAIIVLNPADPPMIMRDTVLCLAQDGDPEAIVASVEAMAAKVAAYVPGYRLKQAVQVTPVPADEPLDTLLGPIRPVGSSAPTGRNLPRPRWKVAVYLEVEGAGHYLPAYAGNLDIMTSAALQAAERIAAHRIGVAA